MLPSCGETRARPHLHDSSNLRLAGQPQRQKVPLGIAALHRVCSGGALLCRIHLLLNVCAIALRRRALSQRKPGPSTRQEMSVLHTRSLAGSGRGQGGPHAPLGRLSSRQRRAWRERRRVIWWGKHVGAILLELLCGGAQRSWISRHRRCGAHGSVGTPITSWHAARSCVCFFGASRRILCRALEMKTCIVRCSSASGGEPGTAGAAPDILLAAAGAARGGWHRRAHVFAILVTSAGGSGSLSLSVGRVRSLSQRSNFFYLQLQVWPMAAEPPHLASRRVRDSSPRAARVSGCPARHVLRRLSRCWPRMLWPSGG